MAAPDSWQEVALISVSKKDGTTSFQSINYHALTETIDISEGDYPFEGIPDLAGGRIPKQSPQEDGEVTLELYPVSNDLSNGMFQLWSGSGSTTQPLDNSVTFSSGVSRVRDRFRVSVMWTNDTGVANADDSVHNGTTATGTFNTLRFSATECRIISHKSEFTDGILKSTVTFKWPAFNSAGTARNANWQSLLDTATSTTLSALGNYT